MNNKLIDIKVKIVAAKKLSAIQAGKKIQAAESILDDAVEFIDELDGRVSKVERTNDFLDLHGMQDQVKWLTGEVDKLNKILKLCNLDGLINGVADVD